MEQQILYLFMLLISDNAYLSQSQNNILIKLYEQDHKESWYKQIDLPLNLNISLYFLSLLHGVYVDKTLQRQTLQVVLLLEFHQYQCKNREIEKHAKSLHKILASRRQKKYERDNIDVRENNMLSLLKNSTENGNF